MEHAGHHVEAREIAGGGAHCFRYSVVVLHGLAGIELRIGPAEIHNQLAVVLVERGEVWIGGVENGPRLSDTPGVAINVEAGDGSCRIAFRKSNVAEETVGVVLPSAGTAVGVIQFLSDPTALRILLARLDGEGNCADRPAGEDPLTLADDVGVDEVDGGDFGRKKAIGSIDSVGTSGKVTVGMEVAVERIAHEAILEAVGGVALGVFGFRQQL